MALFGERSSVGTHPDLELGFQLGSRPAVWKGNTTYAEFFRCGKLSNRRMRIHVELLGGRHRVGHRRRRLISA